MEMFLVLVVAAAAMMFAAANNRAAVELAVMADTDAFFANRAEAQAMKDRNNGPTD